VFLYAKIFFFSMCVFVFFRFFLFPLVLSVKMSPPPAFPADTPRTPRVCPPPIITAFEEVDNNVLSQRPWRRYVPVFADFNVVGPISMFLDDILDHHRCNRCRSYLCCAQHIFHDETCWAMNLLAGLTYHDIDAIHSYRTRVFRGVMDGWSEWCFDAFDPERHAVTPFSPHHVGFYIRCFRCSRCEGQECRASHHDHRREN